MPFDIAGSSRGYGNDGGGLVAWILVLGISLKIFAGSFGKTKCKGCFEDLLSSNEMVGSIIGTGKIGLIFSVRFSMYLKNSYVDQQTAVAGMWYNTRALRPLKKPFMPATWYTFLTASLRPRVEPIPPSCVLISVLHTSSGVVKAAATAPAAPPATMCTPGEYFFSLFN